ncbi:hypothetical protein AALB53_20490, partial [Lachnospiraceae bacterium 47-T17]
GTQVVFQYAVVNWAWSSTHHHARSLIILRILPRLKAGVIIHFHDIFLPFEIAKSWVKEKALFWNEQYLLQALLIGGDSYKTILPVHYLSRYDASILEAVTGCKPEVFGGGSYWIKKIHA